MNIAAKITGMSKPNGVCIGQDCFSCIEKNIQNNFVAIDTKDIEWKYKDSQGNPYKVYQSV